MRTLKRTLKLLVAGGILLAAAAGALVPTMKTHAADHGDAPNVGNDSGADIADVYFFLDPNDNNRVILIGTIHGFIVPSEAGNFGFFDPNILYRFSIENTGDAVPDMNIDLRFLDDRTTSTSPQTVTVKLPFGGRRGTTFTTQTTAQTLATQPTTRSIFNAPNDIRFFAGPADDPFFFDIPAFNRFTAAVVRGDPNAAQQLQRGRDSFSGYNLLAIAFSIPKALIQGDASRNNNQVGVFLSTNRQTETIGRNNVLRGTGKFRQKDRMANPAVNVTLIPFPRKTEYNNGTPIDDARGRFADSIVATLRSLGTNDANINALAGVAVSRGDYLRLNLTIPNTGPGGGGPATTQATTQASTRPTIGNQPVPDLTDPAGFPNGRRLRDDVVDILTFIVTNQQITTGDNAVGDVPMLSEFPFVALPQQPRERGTLEDNTRN